MNEWEDEKDFRDWYHREGKYTPGKGYYDISEDRKIEPEWQVTYVSGLLSDWEKYAKIGDFMRCKEIDDKLSLACSRSSDAGKLVSLAKHPS